MSRGNQREKARAKNLKAESQVKNKNTMTGSEFQRHKESSAAIMREKQKLADERRAADAGKKK
ncbi:four F5 protein [Aspergillus steynii IBT 23096]|uniref:Four F5 protein n=1 Tax=Aspergillus steynii IBT 23096 TaxID=1392250 RepID=A0A2I2GN90_9EURO|nr:four F5 protein [Aspergillus steynii IBT 23096]PLB54352.1 four F5 protein [Aspergillus steynii IBT 23096]